MILCCKNCKHLNQKTKKEIKSDDVYVDQYMYGCNEKEYTGFWNINDIELKNQGCGSFESKSEDKQTSIFDEE